MRNCDCPASIDVDCWMGVERLEGCLVRARDGALDVLCEGTSWIHCVSMGAGTAVLLGFLGFVKIPYRIRH